MTTMFAFGVKHAEDHDPFVLQELKEFVRKSRQENSPKPSIINGEAIRIHLQGANGPAHFIQKADFKTGLLFVIPIPRLLNILFGARSNKDRPFHGRFRSRASTSGQGVPA